MKRSNTTFRKKEVISKYVIGFAGKKMQDTQCDCNNR
jgi:hypothetical protein